LCYSKHHDEKSVRGKADRGFTHEVVDDGEGAILKNRCFLLLMVFSMPLTL